MERRTVQETRQRAAYCRPKNLQLLGIQGKFHVAFQRLMNLSVHRYVYALSTQWAY
jgi:hypothetical protein